MEGQVEVPMKDYVCKRGRGGCGPAGAVYGFGFIGAIIYFVGHAPTFWLGVLGALKAIIWPALVVYRLLEFLKF